MANQSKATQEVQPYLADLVRKFKKDLLVVPRTYATYTPLELFQRFLVVAPEFKGNASGAYTEYGFEVGAELPDLVNLIFPFITLQVTPSGKYELLKEALLVVARPMPRRLMSIRSDAVSWRSDYPVCFMAFTGAKHTVTAGFKAKVGVKTQPIEGIDLGFNLHASITGDTGLRGGGFHLRDPRPGWYRKGTSRLLTADFATVLGPEIKRDKKREVVAWLKHLRDSVLPTIQDRSLDGIKAQLKDLPIYRQYLPPFRPKTADLLAKLDTILQTLQTQLPLVDSVSNTEKEAWMNQVKWYQDTLQAAQQAAEQVKQGEPLPDKKKGRRFKLPSKYQGYCYVNLAVLEPKGSVNFQAGVGKLLDTQAAAGGALKFVSSRYQTFALSDQNQTSLLLTQDTSTWYKQVVVTGKISSVLKASALPGEAPSQSDWEKSKSLLNSMNYRTATAYWHPPSDSAGGQPVSLKRGSGVSIGVTLQWATVVALAKAIATPPLTEKVSGRISDLANQLKVTEDDCKRFISSFFLEEDLQLAKPYPELYDYGAVIVESSFTFTQQVTIKYDSKAHLGEDLLDNPQFKPLFDAEPSDATFKKLGLKAEAIRLRVRLGDHLANKQSVFQLGFFKTQIALPLPITLDKINNLGNEGVLDINVYWVDEADRKAAIQNSATHAELLEKAVPPVFLVPQQNL